MIININIREPKKCSGLQSAYCSFTYDMNVVNAIKSLRQRYYNSKTTEWEIEVSQLPKLIDTLSHCTFNITGEYKLPPKPITEIPNGFEFKTKPFDHQMDGFMYGLSHNAWLLGDDMGLGKTKQVIDIACARKVISNYKHCLIICGVNGLKWNWVDEIGVHSNEKGYVLGQRKKRNGKIAVGSSKDKLHDVSHLDGISEYFIITNVETLRNKEIAKELALKCDTGEIGLVAIDEIHMAKNATSQQGKGILKLKPECRIAMTGTPIMNQPLDLYMILKWLGYENHSFYAFKNHFCQLGGFGGYEVVGYKNLGEIREMLDIMMLRRLKGDVLDLPDKLRINEYVEMTPKQNQIYKEISMDIQANADKIAESTNPLSQLIRLRQATGYTGIVSSTILESAKIDRMKEIVQEAVENGKKVVIFSNWTKMTTPIANVLREYNPLVITGETNSDDRQNIVSLYQNDPSYPVIIGTIGAMGTGLTLTAGTVEIFMDEPWNKAKKDQAEDRCHRVGTSENITIYTMLCKDTIDERIHELVEQKGEMSDVIIDNAKPKNCKELLNFLLS